MSNEIDHNRRRLVSTAALTFVASQFTFSGNADAQLPGRSLPISGRSSRARIRHSRR
jgi:hypothetical protein